MNIKDIAIKNWIGLVAICAGLAYLGVSAYLDSRPEWWDDIEKKDPCREIRKANDRIGLLMVCEIVTKDVIYLKQERSKWAERLKMAGLWTAFLVNPAGLGYYAMPPLFYNQSLSNYCMDPGMGVIWGHQGVIEYVVDLSQAQVEMKGIVSDNLRPRVQVTVPEPYVDPESVRLNLETFGPILKNKQFKDGDDVMEKMEKIAKAGFVGCLREVADTKDYLREARAAAKTALTAIYTSVSKGAEVDVQFK